MTDVTPDTDTAHMGSQDTLDQTATELARRALAGDIDETDARWKMVALADEASLVTAVAKARVRGPHSLKEDVADELGMLLIQKLTGDVDGYGDLDQFAEGASLAGYVRSLSHSAVPSVIRNVTRRNYRHGLPFDPTERDEGTDRIVRGGARSAVWTTNGTSTTSTDPQALLDTDDADRIRRAEREYAVRMLDRPQEPTGRQEAARALAVGWGLPPFRHITDPTIARRTLQQTERDDLFAAALFRAMLDGGRVHTKVAAAFGGWTGDHFDQVLDLGAAAANVLVVAVAAPRPPAPVAARRLFVRRAIEKADGTVPSRQTRRLAKTFLDCQTEMEFDRTYTASVLPDGEIIERRVDFEAEAAEVAALDHNPFGTTADQVEATLASGLDWAISEAAKIKTDRI